MFEEVLLHMGGIEDLLNMGGLEKGFVFHEENLGQIPQRHHFR